MSADGANTGNLMTPWRKGQSGNPSGLSADVLEDIRSIRRLAMDRTRASLDTITAIRDNEDAKDEVRLAAAVTILKLAGCFNEKVTTDDALVARINELAAEERARRGR